MKSAPSTGSPASIPEPLQGLGIGQPAAGGLRHLPIGGQVVVPALGLHGLALQVARVPAAPRRTYARRSHHMGDDPQRAEPAKQFAQRSLCHGTAVHVVCTAVGAKRREAAREGRQPAVASEVATAGSLSKARLGDRSRRAERRGSGWAANSLAGPGGLGSLTHNTNSLPRRR